MSDYRSLNTIQVNMNPLDKMPLQAKPPKKTKINDEINSLTNSPRERNKLRKIGFSILEEKRMFMENKRLTKKLSEIENRRHRAKTLEENIEFSKSNSKSRQAYRRLRDKEIKEENSVFVVRMLSRLHSSQTLDNNPLPKNHRKASRSTRSNYVELPNIYAII